MTREDVAKLIRMNFTLYKLGAKPLTDEEMETTIDVWAYQFGDYDGDTVADIFKQLSQCLDPSAEWEALAVAARKAQTFLSWRKFPMVTGIDEKGGLLRSDGQKELKALYDKLPPAAKSYAGSVGGLAALAEMPDLTYRRAEFLKQAQADITTAPREAARLRASEPPRKEIEG